MRKFKIKRGVRQGDVKSQKLFILALEDVFKKFLCEERGIKIHGEYLNNQKFASSSAATATNHKIGLKITFQNKK